MGADLRHNTFARNSGGEGSGIHLGYNPLCTDTFTITNSILVSHTVGITVVAGNEARLDGTLWGSGAWANGTDWGGGGTILTGTVNVRGAPDFADPGGGDYHIGLGSAALNAGADVGVTTDVDGQARPQNWGYDLGADELHPTTPMPQAISDLSGTRSDDDLVLDWSPVTQDVLGNPITPDHYVVYRRSYDPYYGPIAVRDTRGTPVNPPFVDAGALGDSARNLVYLVTAVSAEGVESALSNRIAMYYFGLWPANGPGERAYNLVALSVDVPGVTDADSLAAYVGPGVYMVLRHDAATQGLQWRLPGLAGINFPVEVGDAYYFYLDETAPRALSWVGHVPPIGSASFDLTPGDPGGSCAYNFISVPLERDDLVDAATLAADIGGVYSVSRYNGWTQDLTWYMPGGPGENFYVYPGYPYIVCLDETAPLNWP